MEFRLLLLIIAHLFAMHYLCCVPIDPHGDPLLFILLVGTVLGSIAAIMFYCGLLPHTEVEGDDEGIADRTF